MANIEVEVGDGADVKTGIDDETEKAKQIMKAGGVLKMIINPTVLLMIIGINGGVFTYGPCLFSPPYRMFGKRGESSTYSVSCHIGCFFSGNLFS